MQKQIQLLENREGMINMLSVNSWREDERSNNKLQNLFACEINT